MGRAVTLSSSITRVFICDGYANRPTTRAELVERIRRLKCASWADPGDKELRAEIEEAERELRAYDNRNVKR